MCEHVLIQGDQDHLVLQAVQEELLRVTFLPRVHLEIRDFLVLMAQEVRVYHCKRWQCSVRCCKFSRVVGPENGRVETSKQSHQFDR
jgi:hypothetical protein